LVKICFVNLKIDSRKDVVGDYAQHGDERLTNYIITYTEIMGYIQPFSPATRWIRRVSIPLRAEKHKMGIVIAALKERCK
jgi:hypothetical protein